MSAVLAIDLGGTWLRAAVVQSDAPDDLNTLGEWPAPTDLDGFAARLVSLRNDAPAASAVGIAVPGLVADRRCLWIPNLPWLDGIDVGDLLPGMRIALGNDAHLALLAEATRGEAAGLGDAILLAIGTGIGSAVLAAGRIVRGAHGGACSFGWATGDANDPGDPTRGWLERTAAGPALDRIARNIGHADGTALIAAARAGDAGAIEALDGPARAIGVAVASAVALLDPQIVLLAGGVAGAADVLVPPVRHAAQRQLPTHLQQIDIRAGAFGSRAALIGAATAAVSGPDWWRLR
ncbi:MAG: ROK family protein [Hyphomicrobiales bacterium]|nr:ROK family protein [Hyphomicrobiales bacterium]